MEVGARRTSEVGVTRKKPAGNEQKNEKSFLIKNFRIKSPVIKFNSFFIRTFPLSTLRVCLYPSLSIGIFFLLEESLDWQCTLTQNNI